MTLPSLSDTQVLVTGAASTVATVFFSSATYGYGILKVDGARAVFWFAAKACCIWLAALVVLSAALYGGHSLLSGHRSFPSDGAQACDRYAARIAHAEERTISSPVDAYHTTRFAATVSAEVRLLHAMQPPKSQAVRLAVLRVAWDHMRRVLADGSADSADADKQQAISASVDALAKPMSAFCPGGVGIG